MYNLNQFISIQRCRRWNLRYPPWRSWAASYSSRPSICTRWKRSSNGRQHGRGNTLISSATFSPSTACGRYSSWVSFIIQRSCYSFITFSRWFHTEHGQHCIRSCRQSGSGDSRIGDRRALAPAINRRQLLVSARLLLSGWMHRRHVHPWSTAHLDQGTTLMRQLSSLRGTGPCFNESFSSPIVLLCHFEQQVIQHHRSDLGSDHGKHYKACI